MRYYVQVEGEKYPVAAYKTQNQAIARALTILAKRPTAIITIVNDANRLIWQS